MRLKMHGGALWKTVVFLGVIVATALAVAAIRKAYAPKGIEALKVEVEQTEKSLTQMESRLDRARKRLTEANGAKIQEGQERAQVNVATHELAPRAFDDTLTLPGVVEAWHDILLAARNDGPVEWIGAVEGAPIHEGDPIAKIDAVRLVQQVRSREAAEELARLSYERMQRLRKGNATSQDELDNAFSAYRQAQAALAIVRQDLSDATLQSTIGGIVDEVLPDAGEFVSRGDPVARLVDVSKVKLNVDVPEKDIVYLRAGKEAEVLFPDTISGATTGTIFRIAQVADDLSKTFRVEIRVENPSGTLRPGMIARARLLRQRREAAIVVPVYAIMQTEDGPLAYVEQDGKAQARALRTGVRRGMEVEVTEGLKSGDRLIVSGQRNLSDGSLVRVVKRENAQDLLVSENALSAAEQKADRRN